MTAISAKESKGRGAICSGILVDVGAPEESEFDRLTALRNRPDVRARFLDPRPLDLVANRLWLRAARDRQDDTILAIRMRCDGTLCGMIGWSAFDRAAGSVELGRLIVDQAVAGRYRHLHPPHYPGIGLDAGLAVRDYLFGTMGVRTMRTVRVLDNSAAARIWAMGGARTVGRSIVTRADGTTVTLVHSEMTRAEWDSLQDAASAPRPSTVE